jgi:hypothetical protein
VVRAIAPAVGDADHVPHDAAAKKANRERQTPRIAVRRRGIQPSVDDQPGTASRASPDPSDYILTAKMQRFCSSCALFKRHADVTWG